MAEIGELRIAAYRAGGFLSADSQYADRLRSLGTEDGDQVLVAVEPGAAEPDPPKSESPESDPPEPGAGERVVGTVMLQFWPGTGQVVTGPEEAEIRALAVRPDAQGGGIGRQLVQGVIDLAREARVSHLVLCTEPGMRSAHRLYEQAGFVRLAERDWSPAPGVLLLAYGLRLELVAGA
jgi:ribosomal protein S18 acetylase RimI-like enzyme